MPSKSTLVLFCFASAAALSGGGAGVLGVSPKDAGYPLTDSDGRETAPAIRSADMTFNYA